MAVQRSQRMLFEVSSSDELTCTVLTAANMPSSEPFASCEGGSPGKPAARAAESRTVSFPARAAIRAHRPADQARAAPRERGAAAATAALRAGRWNSFGAGADEAPTARRVRGEGPSSAPGAPRGSAAAAAAALPRGPHNKPFGQRGPAGDGSDGSARRGAAPEASPVGACPRRARGLAAQATGGCREGPFGAGQSLSLPDRGLGGALPKLVPGVPAGAEGDCEQQRKHTGHDQDVAGATSREVTSRQLFHAAAI
ncbi:unnamed protein product [Prorocentrum cordatum]|uniref:Uncharacterized protein n=1 Tax=Prorocentrum cordatum TaxID=2364126 RepID=A0ABN9WHN5_9DINO|nr:unnamed protein product [Polarella glacialis]